MSLTRQQIIEADDLPSETVTVKQWGGDVRLRCLTGAERAEYEDGISSTIKDESGKAGIDRVCLFLSYAIINEDGSRMFSADDLAALKAKNNAILMRLFNRAMKLSRMTADDMEDAEKN